MKLIDKLTKDSTFLEKCWKDVYSGKSEDQRKASKGIDDVSLFGFKQNQYENLKLLSDELKSRSYRHLQLYGFTKKKPNKAEYRLITVPSIKDRIVERGMLKIIKPYFEDTINTPVSYCGTTMTDGSKKGIKKAAQFLIELVRDKNFFVFESDIKSFFDEIDKDTLYKMVIAKLPDDSLNEYIYNVIFFEIENLEELEATKKVFKIPSKTRGISQGSPLSPLFANIYLSSFDKQLYEKFGKGLIRYVDDFVYLCKSEEDAIKFYNASLGILNNLKLSMPKLDLNDKESKTKLTNLKLKNDSFSFLGLKFSQFAITSKKGVKELRQKFLEHYLNSNHADYKNLSQEDKLIRMQSKIDGFYNYYKFFHSDLAFKLLNKYIQNINKLSKFKQLKQINETNLDQIITKESWQDLFN